VKGLKDNAPDTGIDLYPIPLPSRL
jgi:hypothetical protein